MDESRLSEPHLKGQGETIPVMKFSWSSLDKSSKVLPLVSGISKVEKMPVIIKNAKISRLTVRTD
jgi:hypothetical protein